MWISKINWPWNWIHWLWNPLVQSLWMFYEKSENIRLNLDNIIFRHYPVLISSKIYSNIHKKCLKKIITWNVNMLKCLWITIEFWYLRGNVYRLDWKNIFKNLELPSQTTSQRNEKGHLFTKTGKAIIKLKKSGWQIPFQITNQLWSAPTYKRVVFFPGLIWEGKTLLNVERKIV